MTSLLGEILVGDPLTEREIDVLALCAEGLTSDQIGGKLMLAGETVKGYRKRAIAKLGARNTTNAVAIAMRRGMLA